MISRLKRPSGKSKEGLARWLGWQTFLCRCTSARSVISLSGSSNQQCKWEMPSGRVCLHILKVMYLFWEVTQGCLDIILFHTATNWARGHGRRSPVYLISLSSQGLFISHLDLPSNPPLKNKVPALHRQVSCKLDLIKKMKWGQKLYWSYKRLEPNW